MKTTVSEMKITLDGIKIRIHMAEDNISELQDKAINIIQNETRKKNQDGRAARWLSQLSVFDS